MISIITCSINEYKLRCLKNSIAETTFYPYEIIVIDNRENLYGICEAYNLGAKQSAFNYLCFVHEDITFKTKHWDLNFIAHFQSPDISLIGILGNTIKTKFPSGVYCNIQHTNRINQLQTTALAFPKHYYYNPHQEAFSEVAILDGMLLGTKKEYWNKIPFDELTLDNFHGYDIDFSLSMLTLGKVIVVYDILIEHSSGGGNTIGWIESQLKVVKKWHSSLPIQKIDLRQKTLLKREKEDLNQFAVSLLKLNYSLKLSYNYSFLAILRSPFQRINLYFIKHLSIQTFQWLKSVI